MILIGSYGRVDLPHVTHFWAFDDPLRAQFNIDRGADVLNALSRIINEVGTFYTYSSASDDSTLTHQLDGAVIKAIRATASLGHAPALVTFTFQAWRQI